MISDLIAFCMCDSKIIDGADDYNSSWKKDVRFYQNTSSVDLENQLMFITQCHIGWEKCF